jgi:hypothetical protein
LRVRTSRGVLEHVKKSRAGRQLAPLALSVRSPAFTRSDRARALHSSRTNPRSAVHHNGRFRCYHPLPEGASRFFSVADVASGAARRPRANPSRRLGRRYSLAPG